MTIYQALAKKLGREPTNAELYTANGKPDGCSSQWAPTQHPTRNTQHATFNTQASNGSRVNIGAHDMTSIDTTAPLFTGKNVFTAGIDFGDQIKAEREGFLIRARVEADEEDFVSVILSVSRCGVMLDRNAASRDGLERDDVKHMTEVANELVDEALEAAYGIIEELARCLE